MAKQERPLKTQIARFINFYTGSAAFEDVVKAAQLARLKPEQGKKLLKDPEVREAVERKLNLLETEQAKLEAKARMLTVNILDHALVEEISNKKNGSVRVKAIELGYRRTGMIRDGEFYVAPDPNANKNAPSIYQAGQLTMRRTVTEEVTQTLPTKELRPTVEILEY